MAFTLTALDKRPFAPPIESPPDRILNMRNACERFGVSDETVSKLEAAGFRSISLLALASVERLNSLKLAKKDQVAVSTLLLTLNATPLEPLYSLKKLTYKKRSAEKKRRATVADRLDGSGSESAKKRHAAASAIPSFGWLDLAAKKENLPPAADAGVTRRTTGGGCAPERRPSHSSCGLRYLAVVSFHPDDLLCGKRGSSVAVPSGVKRIQSMTRSASSSAESKTRPQSVTLPPPSAQPPASPLKTNNKCNRTAGAKSPAHRERPRTPGHTAAPSPLPPRPPTTNSWCEQCGQPMDKVSASRNHRYCRRCWGEYNRNSHPGGLITSPSAYCQRCQRLMPAFHVRKGRRLCGPCYSYTVGGGGGDGGDNGRASGFTFDSASVAAGAAYPFPCRNEKLGCQTVLPPPEIGLHERRCPFSLMQCQWRGCLFVGTYYDHARHTEMYHGAVASDDDRRSRGDRDYSRPRRIV